MRALIVSMLLSFSLLVACAAPTSQAIAPPDATVAAAPAPPAQSGSGRKPSEVPLKMPPLGGPLPPERVGVGVGPAAHVDRSCRADSDCVVKDVGNCCGYFPACVNKSAATDPAAVQSQCGKDGKASICAFPVIEGCRCVRGQCANVEPTVEPSQDPPASDPVR